MNDKLTTIQNELTYLNSNREKYISRLIDILKYCVALYVIVVTIIVIFEDKITQQNLPIIFLYLLPYANFVVGIIALSNIHQIQKVNLALIIDEENIKYMTKEDNSDNINILGWIQYSRTERLSSMLTYATICIVHVIMPFFSYGLYLYMAGIEANFDNLLACILDHKLASNAYVIYLACAVIIIRQILDLRKEINNLTMTFPVWKNGRRYTKIVKPMSDFGKGINYNIKAEQ